MIVVFDSNVWLSELALRSGVGSATRFYLNHRGARLALPEVVRLEVAHNLRYRLLDHIASIRDDYRQILAVFGQLKEVVLPSEDDVEKKIAELFDSVGVELLHVPFTLNSARASFLKTIEKIPPSDRAQQFKDGVLWSDCLDLLDEAPVTLVTEDKAFYENRDYARGLATPLQAEAAARPNPITIVPALTDLLESVKSEIELNEHRLVDAYLAEHGEHLNAALGRLGFGIDHRIDVTHDLYATEESDSLFLTFEIRFAAVDVREEERTDIVLLLRGDGTYVPSTECFSKIRNFGEEWFYREADGTEQAGRNVVLFAEGLVVGHRQVSHSVRYRLTGEGE